MKYLLDTTFVIDHERNVPEAIERLRRIYEDGDDPVVTSIVVSEAFVGAASLHDASLERLLRHMEYIHPGPGAARLAGWYRAEARRRGHTLGLGDALIAATAEHAGAVILTRNVRDFALTPARIESY